LKEKNSKKLPNNTKNQAEINRMKKLSMKAKLFYEKRLIIKYGIAPLRVLVDLASADVNKAILFYKDLLLRRHWCLFYGYCTALKLQRLRHEQILSARAVSHHQHCKLKMVLRGWKLILRIVRAKSHAIEGQASIFSPKMRAFNAWKVAFDRERRLVLKKLRSVSKRGDLSVLRHFLGKWLEFITAEKLENEIKVRSRNTWDKVRNWITK
jgi:hypothetical protein